MIQTKKIVESIPHVLKTIEIPGLGKKNQGKVRDFYIKNGDPISQAVEKVFPLITGAFSLVMMDKNNLIAVRDTYGMRPLALGKIKNG